MNLEKTIAEALTRKHKTLSVAESCTGGLLGHRITNFPGSSKHFHGGVIVYANAAKIKLLGVSTALIKTHGAVSAPVAEKMAKSVRKIFKSSFGISITGIAGPSGAPKGAKEKPVGLTYVAAADDRRVVCREFHFKGSRLKIKTSAAQAALELLLEII